MEKSMFSIKQLSPVIQKNSIAIDAVRTKTHPIGAVLCRAQNGNGMYFFCLTTGLFHLLTKLKRKAI